MPMPRVKPGQSFAGAGASAIAARAAVKMSFFMSCLFPFRAMPVSAFNNLSI